jgi:hypothetical protein
MAAASYDDFISQPASDFQPELERRFEFIFRQIVKAEPKQPDAPGQRVQGGEQGLAGVGERRPVRAPFSILTREGSERLTRLPSTCDG